MRERGWLEGLRVVEVRGVEEVGRGEGEVLAGSCKRGREIPQADAGAAGVEGKKGGRRRRKDMEKFE